MKKVTGLLVLLLGATVVQGQGDVRTFVDRITAANPQDRWMPAGTIAFTLTESVSDADGDSLYTISGTIRFNKDHALFERHLTAGAFPWKPNPTHTYSDPCELEIPKDAMISVAPGEMKIYIPSARNMRIFNDDRGGVESFRMVTGGVLPKSVLEGLPQSDTSVSGDMLIVNGADGRSLQITADPQGRITEMIVATQKGRLSHTYSHHLNVAGKWLPGEVVLVSKTPGKEVVTQLFLEFNNDKPTEDDFTIWPDEGSFIQTVDVKAIGTDPKAGNSTAKEKPAGSNSSGSSLMAGIGRPEMVNFHDDWPKWYYSHNCDFQGTPYPNYQTVCCPLYACYENEPCGDWVIYWHHHNCLLDPSHDCYGTRLVIEDHWHCYCHLEWPVPGYCQYKCYPNTDTYWAVIEYNVCSTE